MHKIEWRIEMICIDCSDLQTSNEVSWYLSHNQEF